MSWERATVYDQASSQIDTKRPRQEPVLLYGDVQLETEARRYAGEFSEENIAGMNICQQAIFYHRTIFQLLGKFELKYTHWPYHAFNIRCFGDTRIRKLYVPIVIADYEGNGLSTRGDVSFDRDLPGIIRRNFGYKRYVIHRLGPLRRRLTAARDSPLADSHL
jgi:hypothetical protein